MSRRSGQARFPDRKMHSRETREGDWKVRVAKREGRMRVMNTEQVCVVDLKVALKFQRHSLMEVGSGGM